MLESKKLIYTEGQSEGNEERNMEKISSVSDLNRIMQEKERKKGKHFCGDVTPEKKQLHVAEVQRPWRHIDTPIRSLKSAAAQTCIRCEPMPSQRGGTFIIKKKKITLSDNL